jgi:general secretion pathway protein K
MLTRDRVGRRYRAARGADGGYILIPVVLAMALLSFVTLIVSRSAIDDVRLATHTKHRVELRVLADGLTHLMIRRLARTPAPDDARSRADGVPLVCSAASATATLSARNTSGLIDLNRASRETLEKLFSGSGERAAQLAAAVVDFRDADDAPVRDGAETAEYRGAGLKHGPKNAAFSTIDELDQVLGITPDIFARIRPLVTVDGNANGSVDLEVASDEIKALGLAFDEGVRVAGHAYIVQVSVAGRGQHFVREAVVSLGRTRANTVIRSWTNLEGGSLGQPNTPVDGLPACLEALK